MKFIKKYWILVAYPFALVYLLYKMPQTEGLIKYIYAVFIGYVFFRITIVSIQAYKEFKDKN